MLHSHMCLIWVAPLLDNVAIESGTLCSDKMLWERRSWDSCFQGTLNSLKQGTCGRKSSGWNVRWQVHSLPPLAVSGEGRAQELEPGKSGFGGLGR